MSHRILSLLAALALLLLPTPARPQAAPAISAEHRAAAERCLEASGIKANLEAGIEAAIARQISQDPGARAYTDLFRAFMNKYMSYDFLKADLVALYAGAFSIAELDDITAFMQSPTGQRYRSTSPMLNAQVAAISQRAVSDHVAELQLAIANRQRDEMDAAREAANQSPGAQFLQHAAPPEEQPLRPQDSPE